METAADGSTPTRVNVDLWVENQDGITTSTGHGTVTFDPLPLAVH